MQEGLEPNVQPVAAPLQSSKLQVWWRLTRPHTLTASFVPVSIGTALAYENGHYNGLLFIIMLLASLLIQAATNMFNEYYDYVRGLDNEHSIGIGGAIVRDGISAKTVLYSALIFYGISMLLGVYICSHSSWWLVIIGLLCMAVGYFYTGGPYPIAYTPLGELFSGVFMGVSIILISFFIQTGTVTMNSVLISVPICILVGAILMANNIRDLDGDKEFGRKTLAILLGRDHAVSFLTGMFVVSYIWVFALVLLQLASPWLLLVLVSVPKAISAAKGFRGHTAAIHLMPAMKATAQTNTLFGLFLCIGILLHHWI
jgi:1,4-dihydroxy-2-naphthoate octaprenyltransferase